MRIEFDPLNREEATAVRLFLDAQFAVSKLRDPSAGPVTAKDFDWYEDHVTHHFTGQIVEGDINTLIEPETVVQAEEPTEEPTEEPSGDELPETDKNGVAWNADLHSTPAKINKDGTWRAKRGVTAAPPAPEPETPLAETAVTENAPAEPAATTTSAPPAPSEAPKPPAPAPAPTPPVQPAGAPSFLDVMKAVTAAQKDGKISPAQVKELAGTVVDGASSVNDLNGPAKAEERLTFLALLAETIGG